MNTAKKADKDWVFDLTGGRLCLDFANTVSGERLFNPIERLHEYNDLLSWSRQVGIFDIAETRNLAAQAQLFPQEATQTYEQAIQLREALFRVFTAAMEKHEPNPDDLGLLNAMSARSLGHQQLTVHDGHYSLGWSRRERDLDCMLWPVVKSAIDLLTSEEFPRLRLCEAAKVEGCGWLFLDETRNQKRRWCSMQDCGNRAKARRHYYRHRAASPGHSP